MNSWIRLKLEAVRLSSQSLAGISTVLEFRWSQTRMDSLSAGSPVTGKAFP